MIDLHDEKCLKMKSIQKTEMNALNFVETNLGLM